MRLKLPKLSPIATTSLWVVLAVFAAVRCGEKSKDDDDDEDPPTVQPGGEALPQDWDGKSDWSGSPFKMVDE